MSGTSAPSARERRLARKKAQRELRGQNKAKGLAPLTKTALPNRMSEYKSVEKEQQARQEALTIQWQIMQGLLPVLLGRLAKIPDPRQPLTRIFHTSSAASADIAQSQGVCSSHDLDVFQHTFARSISQTP